MKTETGNVHAGFFPRSISLFRIFSSENFGCPETVSASYELHLFWRGCEQPFPSRTEALPVNPDPKRLGLQETMLRPRRADRRLQGWAKSSRQLRIHSMISVFYSTEANFWVIFSLAVMRFNKRDRCNQIILRNECFKKKISIWTNPHLALRV